MRTFASLCSPFFEGRALTVVLLRSASPVRSVARDARRFPLPAVTSGCLFPAPRDVGDRWALDLAGPLPTHDGGERYVIAAVEYVTRYAVAATVEKHEAENVAAFLMRNVVLMFGPFRELLSDGAPELTGKVIEQLVVMLQAEQVNPVPYRPQMIGLVERFHRTWKDIVATYMHDEKQHDWNVWVDFAVYAYNSGRHSTVALTPNELMMGRRLRSPNELLRTTGSTEAGELNEYHKRLLRAMESSRLCAEAAREKEQRRQAKYYNTKVRANRTIEPGDRVWMYKPPRGAKASKFVHQWMGPLRVVEPAGYDNYLIEREDVDGNAERFIAHASFLVSYHYPARLQWTLRRSSSMKVHFNGTTKMTQRQARIMAQRRHQCMQQRHREARNEIDEQWQIRAERTEMTKANWWNCEGGGGEIQQANTSWNSNYDRHVWEDHQQVKRSPRHRANEGGSLSLNTRSRSETIESCKTLWLGKSCNECAAETAPNVAADEAGDEDEGSVNPPATPARARTKTKSGSHP